MSSESVYNMNLEISLLKTAKTIQKSIEKSDQF